ALPARVGVARSPRARGAAPRRHRHLDAAIADLDPRQGRDPCVPRSAAVLAARAARATPHPRPRPWAAGLRALRRRVAPCGPRRARARRAGERDAPLLRTERLCERVRAAAAVVVVYDGLTRDTCGVAPVPGWSATVVRRWPFHPC